MFLWVGFGGLVLGAIDPLEGSLLILPASAVLAFGAHVGRLRTRRLLIVGFGLVAVGVALLWWLSALGGIGGTSGRSMWWGLLLMPYPAGWLLGVAGAVQSLRGSRRT
jgi:hypothetical protein